MASTDSAADNKAFAEKNEASFPILSDPGKTVAEAYGVLADAGYARRWTYYIDGDGIIREIDTDVDPRVAGEILLAHLEALGVPAAGEQSAP